MGARTKRPRTYCPGDLSRTATIMPNQRDNKLDVAIFIESREKKSPIITNNFHPVHVRKVHTWNQKCIWGSAEEVIRPGLSDVKVCRYRVLPSVAAEAAAPPRVLLCHIWVLGGGGPGLWDCSWISEKSHSFNGYFIFVCVYIRSYRFSMMKLGSNGILFNWYKYSTDIEQFLNIRVMSTTLMF